MWISAVGLAGSDVFAEGFEVVHFRFDAVAGMVSCPSRLEGSAIVLGGSQSFVSGNCGWAVFLPRPTISCGAG